MNDKAVIFSNDTIKFDEDKTAETQKTKGQYRKMLFRYGDFVNAMTGKRTTVFDEDLAREIKQNFDNKVINSVSVPITHTTDPLKNTGELVGMEIDDDGLYGILEIRDYDAIYRIDNKLFFDVSIRLNRHYIDTETGEDKGAVIEHVALVNDPYIEHMSGFEAILASSRAEDDENSKGRSRLLNNLATQLSKQYGEESVIMLSVSASANNRKDNAMEVPVLNDRDFDVEVTFTRDGAEVTETVKADEEILVPQDQEETVKQQIADAVDPNADDSGKDSDSEDESKKGKDQTDHSKSTDDDSDAEKGKDDKANDDEKVELSKSQAEEYSRLRKENAELKAQQDYAKLADEGFLTPAQESMYKELHLTSALSDNKIDFSREGKSTVGLMDVVNDLIKAGGKKVDFSQTGSGKESDEDKKGSGKLSEQFSKAELEVLEQEHRITADRMDALAAKSPEFAKSMKNLIGKDE